MSEFLAFNDGRVQAFLREANETIFEHGRLSRVVRVALRSASFQEAVGKEDVAAVKRQALGAEALFAVWKTPIPRTTLSTTHLVKVDCEGLIIPGSQIPVGTAGAEGELSAQYTPFSEADVAIIEELGSRQAQLPWQPSFDTVI